MTRALALLGLAACLASSGVTGGCTTTRLEDLVQAANDRQWKACVEVQGSYGLFAAGSLRLVTGGATFAECWGGR